MRRQLLLTGPAGAGLLGGPSSAVRCTNNTRNISPQVSATLQPAKCSQAGPQML